TARALYVIGVRRHKDDGSVPRVAVLAQKLRGLEPIHPRHVDIEQDDGEFPLEHTLQRLLSGGGHDHLGIEAIEDRRVRQPLFRKIIDDENPRARQPGGAWLRARVRIADGGHAAPARPDQRTTRSGRALRPIPRAPLRTTSRSSAPRARSAAKLSISASLAVSSTMNPSGAGSRTRPPVRTT